MSDHQQAGKRRGKRDRARGKRKGNEFLVREKSVNAGQDEADQQPEAE
ncbi:hypothetical protein [Nitratireductor arenosus]|nr:hypothetical protein [Nitratireductor arenosus]